MPEAPGYRSRIMPSGRVGAAFVGPHDIYALTRGQRAEAEFGRAMQRVAGQIATIAIERQEARDETAAADATKKLADYDYAALTDLETRTFEETGQFERAESEYLKGRGQIISQATKGLRPAVAGRFRNYGKQSQTQARLRYHNKLFPKEQQFHQASFLAKFDDYKRRGEKAKADLLIEQYRPWFTPTQMEAFTQGLDHDIEYNAGIHLAENNPAWLLEVAADKDFFPHLDTQDKERLKNLAETRQQQQVAQSRQLRDEYYAQKNEEFWQVFADDNLTELKKQVDESELPVTGMGGKKWWNDLIDTRTADIAKGEDILTNEQAAAQLDEDVIKVHMGAADYHAVKERIIDARYKWRLIDNDRMKQLMTKLNTKYEGYIAGLVKDAYDYGRGQILEQGALTLIGKAPVRRRYALYQQAVDEWVSNALVTGKPFDSEAFYRAYTGLAEMYSVSTKRGVELGKEREARLSAREQKEKKLAAEKPPVDVPPQGLESIWDELNDNEKDTLRSLLQNYGAVTTTEEIVEWYNKQKAE